jgi:uncharacterized protein (DUF1697 family)
MGQYVALLRGINVGGNNLIKMAALKACFEDQGFLEVSTYIQSGNVIFTARKGTPAALGKKVEAALSAAFNYKASVVLRSQKQLQRTVKGAPKGFGTQPEKYRYDVLFVKEPLAAAAAAKDVPNRAGVDQLWAGEGAIYFARLIAKVTQSQLSKIASKPVYQSVTIRNWNTTTALLRLMEAAGGKGA